jgi:glycerol-3-phosphate dehydrogenase (NAD(P)+)
MSVQRRILIIGHGEMGQAMVHLLGARHSLSVWGRRPKGGHVPPDLDVAAAVAEAIIFCVPAPAHGELVARISPRLAASTRCISIAKGVDDQGRCAWQIFHDVLPANSHCGVLYGPMISEEIRAGKPAFADVGTSGDEDFQFLHELFAGSALYLRPCADPLGLSWCAVLKNVYAILFGIADALALGDNLRGYLAVAAVDEIAAISQCLGGRPETAVRLAGLGDLITTATSAGSHHHALGGLLVQGARDRIRGEGIHTLEMVHTRRLFDSTPYPLFSLIAQAVRDPREIRRQVERYLQTLG